GRGRRRPSRRAAWRSRSPAKRAAARAAARTARPAWGWCPPGARFPRFPLLPVGGDREGGREGGPREGAWVTASRGPTPVTRAGPAPASMTGRGFRNDFTARTGQVTRWPRAAVVAANGRVAAPAVKRFRTVRFRKGAPRYMSLFEIDIDLICFFRGPSRGDALPLAVLRLPTPTSCGLLSVTDVVPKLLADSARRTVGSVGCAAACRSAVLAPTLARLVSLFLRPAAGRRG